MSSAAARKSWATRRARAAQASPVPQVSGFAEAAAVTALPDADLLSLFAATGRAVAERFLRRRQVLTSWALVLDYLKSAMAFEPREQFRVLFLDKKNALIADEVLGNGTVGHVPVYVREVMLRALELHASGMILSHNHPSGDPTPSSADVLMTKQLQAAATTLGLQVHDHIIIARDGHASLRQLALM